jgi:hypothetical protein
MSNKNPITNNATTGKAEGWNVKDGVIRKETDPRGRVDLNPKDFDTLIRQKGVNIKVFRSFYCPNVKSVDGAEHEIDCPLCNGSGFMDVDCIECKAFISNQENERLMSQGGDHDGNTVYMSFPIGIELQYFTRVELVDFTEIYYQRVLRKPGTNTDVLKYRACRVNVVVDKNNVQYYQQTDFDMDQNGNIIWLTKTGARKPADNVIYSIHYETHIQFRAVKAMHVVRFSQYKTVKGIEFVKFPEQWMMTKEFLLRRRDINTNQDLVEGPFDNHTNTTGENG